MGVLILRYYLSLSSIIIISILLYLLFIFNYKILFTEDKIININKGANLNLVSNELFKKTNFFEMFFYSLSIKISNKFINNIHYGDFLIKKNSTFKHVLLIISNFSNIDHKITIVEGWQEYQLNSYINSFFNQLNTIRYEDVLADTYYIKSANNFSTFYKMLKNKKNEFFLTVKDKSLLYDYSPKELMIIASMIEKEALDDIDKKKVGSVILNRLKKRMKLQIDATVIYALTEGKIPLGRALTLKDLKIKHPYNTYYIQGLPPNLISYVGIKTIEILLENYKTDFLFYFYDKSKKKHIYSKSFEEHKNKLNAYRKKSK